MEQMNYASPLFVRSRRAYSTQCMLEYFIALLVSDAFLSKLLTVLGLSDAQVGVISSLISAAFLFQLASVFLVDRIRRVKRCLLFFTTFSQMLFASLYFLPFLNLPAALRQPTVVCLLLLGYFCNYFVTTMVFQWGNSFVSPDLRGEFSAGKEMQSLLGGMIFTLLIGFMVDTLEARGRLMSAFLYIALIGLLTSAGNYICIRRIGGREALLSRPASAPRLREIARHADGLCRIVIRFSLQLRPAQDLADNLQLHGDGLPRPRGGKVPNKCVDLFGGDTADLPRPKFLHGSAQL